MNNHNHISFSRTADTGNITFIMSTMMAVVVGIAVVLTVAIVSSSSGSNATGYEYPEPHQDEAQSVDVTLVKDVNLMLDNLRSFKNQWSLLPWQHTKNSFPGSEGKPKMHKERAVESIHEALKQCYDADDLVATAVRISDAGLDVQYRVVSSCWSDNKSLMRSFRYYEERIQWDGGLWLPGSFVYGVGEATEVTDMVDLNAIPTTHDLTELGEALGSFFLDNQWANSDGWHQTISTEQLKENATLQVELIKERATGHRLTVWAQPAADGYIVQRVRHTELVEDFWEQS